MNKLPSKFKLPKFGPFSGMNKVLAEMTARKIDKGYFIEALGNAWYSEVRISTDIETELTAANDRIKKSGFQKVFKIVGVTEEDLRSLLLKIKKEKAEAAGIQKDDPNGKTMET